MKYLNRLPPKSTPNLLSMMRLIISIILLTTITNACAQDLVGKYKAYYGHTLALREDSTFRYEWNFDLASSWSVGRWSVSKGIVNLHIKNVFDTLARDGQPDSLVLSMDEKSDRICSVEFGSSLISGGGQGRTMERIPDRLVVRGERLYPIDKAGKIIRRKESGIWNKKKRPIYYFRTSTAIDY